MSIVPNEKELDARLAAISQAQGRARVAILVASVASGAILTALWNSYLSWDRRWADLPSAPKLWGQKQLVAEQIRAWLETNTVNVSLLGIRVSVSDAAVLGSIALVVLSYYVCVALRQENEEIGALLIDALGFSEDDQRTLFRRMHAPILFSRAVNRDSPYTSLKPRPPETRASRFGWLRKLFRRTDAAPPSKKVLTILTYLPAAATLAILVSDLYYATRYVSPWFRNDDQSVWYVLSSGYRAQLVLMDVFGALMFVIALRYCCLAWQYRSGTQAVVDEFAAIVSAPSAPPASATTPSTTAPST